MTITSKELIEQVDKARNFPYNTCPSSRFLQQIGESLINKQMHPMLVEETKHCGETMLWVVLDLYELRTRMTNLEKCGTGLVSECAQVIQNLIDLRVPASEYPERLKKHFGVE